MILRRALTLSYYKPHRVVSSVNAKTLNNITVTMPVNRNLVFQCQNIAVFDLGTQIRNLSISLNRFNSSPEATQEILNKVAESTNSETVVPVETSTNKEPIFEIPDKPKSPPEVVTESNSSS